MRQDIIYSPQDNIPPKATLFQHVKRALIQASVYWSQATVAQQNIPDFSEWDWHKDSRNKCQPLQTTMNDASEWMMNLNNN